MYRGILALLSAAIVLAALITSQRAATGAASPDGLLDALDHPQSIAARPDGGFWVGLDTDTIAGVAGYDAEGNEQAAFMAWLIEPVLAVDGAASSTAIDPRSKARSRSLLGAAATSLGTSRCPERRTWRCSRERPSATSRSPRFAFRARPETRSFNRGRCCATVLVRGEEGIASLLPTSSRALGRMQRYPTLSGYYWTSPYSWASPYDGLGAATGVTQLPLHSGAPAPTATLVPGEIRWLPSVGRRH